MNSSQGRARTPYKEGVEVPGVKAAQDDQHPLAGAQVQVDPGDVGGDGAAEDPAVLGPDVGQGEPAQLLRGQALQAEEGGDDKLQVGSSSRHTPFLIKDRIPICIYSRPVYPIFPRKANPFWPQNAKRGDFARPDGLERVWRSKNRSSRPGRAVDFPQEIWYDTTKVSGIPGRPHSAPVPPMPEPMKGGTRMLPTILWLVALVVFLVVEGLTVGLVSIWFSAGALAALLLSLWVENIWAQIACFLAVSALCLAAFRPLALKYLNPARRTPTNADRVLGMEGMVTQAIDNLRSTGTVQVRGMDWSARSAGEETIPAGTRVRVVRLEGVKLFVEPEGAPAAAPRT